MSSSPPAGAAHRLIDLSERVEFAIWCRRGSVCISMSTKVNACCRGRAADAEHRHEGLALQQVVRIVHGEDASEG